MQCKTFYLERDLTKKSQVFNLNVPLMTRFVDLSPIIMQVSDWSDKYFKIYSAEQDSYLSLKSICEQSYIVPKEYLPLNVVLIKYYETDSQQQAEIQSDDNKKQRSKQRSIRQVVDLVQKWRQLHNPSGQAKKLNLQEAAKIVGISKKSLDDYFFQLRMGEKYGFDFSTYINSKIGLLRTFVKQKEQQSKRNGGEKNNRHPKKLKIIEEISVQKKNEQQPSLLVLKAESESNQKDQENKMKEVVGHQNCLGKMVDSDHLFWGSPFSSIDEKQFLDCENNFFKDFENLMEEPNDPFIPFASMRKSKSIFSDDPNSCLNLDF